VPGTSGNLKDVLAGLRRLPGGQERHRDLEWMLYLQNSVAALQQIDGNPIPAENHSREVNELLNHLQELPYEDPSRLELLEELFRRRGLEKGDLDELSKGVIEGEKVNALYDQLKTIRSLYQWKGWTFSEIRKQRADLGVAWEWIDRIDDRERKAEFCKVYEWQDGDWYVFRLIETLYKYCPHLKKKPSWNTVRDWRKAYLGFLKHGTPNGRRRKNLSPKAPP